MPRVNSADLRFGWRFTTRKIVKSEAWTIREMAFGAPRQATGTVR
jgi:hypothetical protein